MTVPENGQNSGDREFRGQDTYFSRFLKLAISRNLRERIWEIPDYQARYHSISEGNDNFTARSFRCTGLFIAMFA